MIRTRFRTWTQIQSRGRDRGWIASDTFHGFHGGVRCVGRLDPGTYTSIVIKLNLVPSLGVASSIFYDKQTKAINFPALGPKNQLKNLESKVTTSFFRRDMASFDSSILS